MSETQIETEILLIQADEWAQGLASKTKLDSVRDVIFHLRYNKQLSYTAIKKFLSEAGIKTSTGSLSKFYRSRFNAEMEKSFAPTVLTRISELKASKAQTQ